MRDQGKANIRPLAKMATGTPPMTPIAEVVEEIPRRQSVFREILDDEDDAPVPSFTTSQHVRPTQKVRFRSKTEILDEDEGEDWEDEEDAEADSDNTSESILVNPALAVVQPKISSRLYRIGAFALLLALAMPLLQDLPFMKTTAPVPFGVKGGVIQETSNIEEPVLGEVDLERRQSDPTVVCTRFGQQSKGVIKKYATRLCLTLFSRDYQWNALRLWW